MDHRSEVIALCTALLVVIAHDVKTLLDARHGAKLYLKALKAHKEAQGANEAQIKYLVHLLAQNGITVTDFDLIALEYHND